MRGTPLDERLHERILTFLATSCYHCFSSATEFYSLAVNIEAAVHGIPMASVKKFRKSVNPGAGSVELHADLVAILHTLVSNGFYETPKAALRQAAWNLLTKCLDEECQSTAPGLAQWRPGKSWSTLVEHPATWGRHLRIVPDSGGPIGCPAHRMHWDPSTRFTTWAHLGRKATSLHGGKSWIEPFTADEWTFLRWSESLPQRATPPKASDAPRETARGITPRQWLIHEAVSKASADVDEQLAPLMLQALRAQAQIRRDAKDFSPSKTREALRSGSFLRDSAIPWRTRLHLAQLWQSGATPFLERAWANAFHRTWCERAGCFPDAHAAQPA